MSALLPPSPLYPNYRLYGPYYATRRKSRTKIIAMVKPNGKSTSMLFKDYVMEQHLGRRLVSGEVIVTKDGNELNTSLKNLFLKEATITRTPLEEALPLNYQEVICEVCNKPLVITQLYAGSEASPKMHRHCVSKYLRMCNLKAKQLRQRIAEEEGDDINGLSWLKVQGTFFKQRAPVDLKGLFPDSEDYYSHYAQQLTANALPETVYAHEVISVPSTYSERAIVKALKSKLNIAGKRFKTRVVLTERSLLLCGATGRQALYVKW